MFVCVCVGAELTLLVCVQDPGTLMVYSKAMLDEFNLLSYFKVPKERVRNFITRVRGLYRGV